MTKAAGVLAQVDGYNFSEVTFWYVALGIGFVVILVVIALLTLLVRLVQDIDQGVVGVENVLARTSNNTSATFNIPLIAQGVDDILNEGLQARELPVADFEEPANRGFEGDATAPPAQANLSDRCNAVAGGSDLVGEHDPLVELVLDLAEPAAEPVGAAVRAAEHDAHDLGFWMHLVVERVALAGVPALEPAADDVDVLASQGRGSDPGPCKRGNRKVGAEPPAPNAPTSLGTLAPPPGRFH
jgi:energy-converting hydrogenase Eha subunit A